MQYCITILRLIEAQCNKMDVVMVNICALFSQFYKGQELEESATTKNFLEDC